MFNKFEQQMASRVELSSEIELSNEAFHYIDKFYQKVVVVKYGVAPWIVKNLRSWS